MRGIPVSYSKEVLDHYDNPRNVGKLDQNRPDTARALVGKPACGDVMQLDIQVENDTIVDARFKTYGCGSAIASSSLLTEWCKGLTLDEAADITDVQIAQELSLPPVKIHCSNMASEAIQTAIRNYREKQNGPTD